MSKIVALALAGLLSACGTYRTNSGGYQRGGGGYKTASDYAPQGDGFALTEKLSRGQTFVPSGAFKLHWPVRNVRINRGFNSSINHQGMDLGGPKGTPILAAHEGVVIYTGRDFRGYGNMVLIEYNKEWATLYGHLNDIVVDEGRIVKAGDPVGGMGATGRATGVHLHFELIKDRAPVDPLPYLTRNSRMASR